MAYRAEIQISVTGIGQLGALQKSLNQVSNTVDLINKKRIDQGFSIQNINTYNNILARAVQNVNKAAMGSQEELQAVRDLVRAKNSQIAAQERLNRLVAQEVANQRQVVATANAGFGIQGPAAPPVPAGARRGPSSPIGGARGIAGSPADRAAQFENLALGAGFPLLFGGGAGQVAGGLLGSFVGTGFGGQILGSAIGQILEDAQRRIAEIGNATKTLNLDTLRQSAIFVNNELDITVQRLQAAGQAEAARAEISRQTTLQTGLLPQAVDDITNNVNLLSNTWNEFLSAVSGTLSIIGTPFVSALTLILQGLAKTLQLVNLIGTGISGWIRNLVTGFISRLPGGIKLLEQIKNLTGATTEEQEKQIAALVRVTDAQNTQIMKNNELLRLESQRTLGRTLAEKAINTEIDKQISKENIRTQFEEKAKQLRQEYANVATEAGRHELELALAQNDALMTQALKQQDIKNQLNEQGFLIEANTQKYDRAAEAVQRQISALERGNQIEQSRFSAEAALNDLYGAQLQRQYELTTTAQQRYNIAIAMFDQQIRAAEIEYQQALANNKILEQKAILEAQLVEIKFKQMAAEKAIAIAQAESRGNTPDQIRRISAAYDEALGIQRSVVEDAYAQVRAVQEIAKNQEVVAQAVLKTKIIQAESALAQKLVSDEIGLSKEAANELAGRLAVARMETVLLGRNMAEVSAAAQTAAYNIGRAFTEQQRLNAARGVQINARTASVRRAAQGAYWPGGFKAFAEGGMVTRPTLGLVGEGGEPEYIIPQSKAMGFVSNWMAGARGSDAIPRGTTATVSSVQPQVNIQTGPVLQQDGHRYVTIQDLEKAMVTMAGTLLGNSRSNGGRRYQGVR